ncbi:MAG: arylsulfotransferase family protein [Candidatus Nanopelagicales bacterium]
MRKRLRCSKWSFTPPAKTVCRKSAKDRIRTKRKGSDYLAYSSSKRRWVTIPYSWNARRGLLRFDASKLRVAQPKSGSHRIWRYTCSKWKLRSGTTKCQTGRAQRVTAKFSGPNSAARIYLSASKKYVASPYRWRTRGGYLVLDARLIPAPKPAASASITFRSTLTPAWSPTITDYTVRCGDGSFQADIKAANGGSVTFDASAFTSAASPSVSMTAGQAVAWTIRTPGKATINQQARCLPEDFPTWTTQRTGSPTAQWLVFAPDLGKPQQASPTPNYVVVADNYGTPIWWKAVSDYVPVDAKVLPSGLIGWSQSGYTFSQISTFRQLDWAGNPAQSLGSGLSLDMHDVQPTDRGTYLGIRYTYRDCPGSECVDMTAYTGGSDEATLIDGEVVEFDADGNILWTWKARDHIPLSDWTDKESEAHSAISLLALEGHDNWDINHLNSVQDDGNGVIISARHLNAVYRINKSDGSVDWKLGGTPTADSLAISGLDQPFASQHDARRLPNGNISVFDNGTEDGNPPRVLEFSVDANGKTATVVDEVTDDRISSSGCCGSTRKLTDGHRVTAWGGTPWITETDSSGDPILTLHSDASTFSYRVDPIEPGRLNRTILVDGMNTMNPR